MIRTLSYKEALAVDFVLSYALLTMKNLLTVGNSFVFEHNFEFNTLLLLFTFCLYGITFFIYRKFTLNLTSCAWLAVIGLFWLGTYTYNPALFHYSHVGGDLVYFVIYSIPAFYVLSQLKDLSFLFKIFIHLRWFFLLVALFSVYCILSRGGISGTELYATYSMSFGRNLILPSFFFLYKFFEKINVWDFIGFLACCVMIFLFGSRFPLLCISAYFLWKLWKYRYRRAIVLGSVIGVIFLTVLFFFWVEIITLLYDYLANVFNMRSRSLLLLLNENFVNNDSGRSIIWNNLISKINESPIWGYGAGGGVVALDGELAHSFPLDTLANLGYIFGGLFLVYSGYLIFRTCYVNRFQRDNMEYIKMLLCCFLPICFIQLSMWTANHFWQLIALSCNHTRGEKDA